MGLKHDGDNTFSRREGGSGWVCGRAPAEGRLSWASGRWWQLPDQNRQLQGTKGRGCGAEPRPTGGLWLPGSSSDSSPYNCCPCESISSGGADLIFLREDGKARFPPLSRLSAMWSEKHTNNCIWTQFSHRLDQTQQSSHRAHRDAASALLGFCRALSPAAACENLIKHGKSRLSLFQTLARGDGP